MNSSLNRLFHTIAKRDPSSALSLIALSPSLAHERATEGATRGEATPWFLEEIEHYIYTGDTALHVAAAAYGETIARALIGQGADTRAANRRGAEPLHYAADGNPTSNRWNPPAQSAMVSLLVESGADPNARNKDGVAPLHRAVRTRSTGAVRALLAAGADPRSPNARGSTPLELATRDTGRGGSGTNEARLEQQRIIALLRSAS